jgi:hypothetical protein
MEKTIDIYKDKLGDPTLGTTLPAFLRAFLLADTILSLETKIKQNIATELRDSIESLCAPATYQKFLSKLWPVFKKILDGEPEFRATHPDHVSVRCCSSTLVRLTALTPTAFAQPSS